MQYNKQELEVIGGVLGNVNVNIKDAQIFLDLIAKTAAMTKEAPDAPEVVVPEVVETVTEAPGEAA